MPPEHRRFADWFPSREDTRWEAQLDRDASAGKLDFLFRKAEEEAEQGLLRDWPPK